VDENKKIELQERRLDQMREAQIDRERTRRQESDSRRNEAQRRREQTSALQERRHQNNEKIYELKRSDKIIDQEISSHNAVSIQKEITSREVMLARISEETYFRNTGVDFRDFVRRENILVQSHKIRAQRDSEAEINIIEATSRAELQQIKERTKGEVVKKLVDHAISIKEKRIDAEIQQDQTRLLHAQKKDFLIFEMELKQSMLSKSDEEVADIYLKLQHNQEKYGI